MIYIMVCHYSDYIGGIDCKVLMGPTTNLVSKQRSVLKKLTRIDAT